MTKQKAISRRDFIKSGVIGGASVAAAGMLSGYASEGSSASAASAASSVNSGSVAVSSESDAELIPAAYLNPQDYDYRGNTLELTSLFSPFAYGSIQLSHRMMKSAAGSATYLNGPTDEMFQYYMNFAKGGVELIMVEYIDWFGPTPSAIPDGFTQDDIVAWGKSLSEECAKYGASLGVQYVPIPVKNADDMTVDEIIAAEDAAATYCKWYKDMGFKAVQFHMTGAPLGNQFVSRYYNHRTDDYGCGSIENRARFACECAQKIHEAAGDDFVIEALLECVEENDNITNNIGQAFMELDNVVTNPHSEMTTIEEAIGIGKCLETAGFNAICIRLGIPDYHPAQFASDLYFLLNGVEGASAWGYQWDFSRHFQGKLIADHSGAGMLINIAEMFKKEIGIPIGAVTYMDPARAPDFFEQAIADGKVDYYSMNRPLTVDPEYVNKLRDGRIDEIAPCCRCLHCHIGSNESNRAMGYCRVNACTQRVMTDGGPATYELPELTGEPKNVMVVGGGPAGMEAARIAAARGHKVTLYDKGGELGGRLAFAAQVKGPHENLADLKAYLERQLELNGVTVVLNKEVDTDFINSEAPDAVVLAVGSLPGEVGVEGSGNVPVIDFDDFETADTGDNVIVYGSNAQAFDCALWLTVHKKNVQMVTPNANADLDKQQSQHAHRFMTTTLYSLGVKAWPNSTISNVGDGEVTITSGDCGVDLTFPCSAIINAADLQPNTSLLDGVTVAETYAIGDCSEPYNIALAIRGGNDVGRAL